MDTCGMLAAADREITWDGFYNARDLGGLPTDDGRVTRRGALIRSADLRLVTAAGWRAASDAGVRTIIDLRNDDEVRPQAGPGLTALGGSAQFAAAAAGQFVPAGMYRTQVPMDGVEDTKFWRYLNVPAGCRRDRRRSRGAALALAGGPVGAGPPAKFDGFEN